MLDPEPSGTFERPVEEVPRALSSMTSDQVASQIASLDKPETPPVIESFPSGLVHLPGGFISKTGVVKTARVRELDGFAEEKLSRIDIDKNSAIWITELLFLGVELLGDEKPTREMLGDLLIGDRDALLLGIRQTTYGNTVEFKLTCTECGQESDIGVEIDKDVPVVEIEDPMVRTFDVPIKRGTATVQLLTGNIQEAYSENIEKKTQAEVTTIMLSRSVIKINGEPTFNNENAVRALSVVDRAALGEFIATHQPGPKYGEIRVP
jgi:uncharacterized pyridoxamine 5'-phosphate oxidase family protein